MKKRIIIAAILLTMSLTATFAQPIPGGRPDDGGAGNHDEESAPIEPGTSVLFALGVAYVSVKLYRKREKVVKSKHHCDA
ncbi:MAG: hypothetical protein LBR28_07925 [Bacteroidales bacterium]|jgi:hypothetical protein|nr:hypothetical protein [Bacteroidales bacterium]